MNSLYETGVIHGRFQVLNNDHLKYYERYLLLKTALTEVGKLSSIVHLPINMPELYQYYVPLDAIFFLTIYNDWGREKHRYGFKMSCTLGYSL